MSMMVNPYFGTATPTPTPPSFLNVGASGNRYGFIAITSNMSFGGGTVYDMINGTLAQTHYFNNQSGNGTGYIRYEFLNARAISELKWYQDNSSTHGTWRFEGSNDGSSWTQLGSDFTLTGSASPTNSSNGLFTFGNTTAYKYYRLRHMSGNTSSSPWLTEVEFKIDEQSGYGATTSYANSGGTGDRTASITVTATGITTGGGSLSHLVNGSQSNQYFWSAGSGTGAEYLKFDFGSAKIVDRIYFYASDANAHGMWQVDASNDNSTWTDISVQFPLGGTNEFRFDNVTAYRYLRFKHMSGTRSGSPYIREFEFRIA